MKFSYAKDKKQDGVYNIRVIGSGAAGFSGQTITVTTASGAGKQETLGKCFWSGVGDDGVEVALYAKAGAGAPQGSNGVLEKRVAALEAQVRSLLSGSTVSQEDLPF
jgi:hypothetical protein